MCKTSANLKGKTAIITGGSSGIGFETAKVLAHHGARVIIASRNETKLIEAAANIRSVTGNQNVAYRTIDLASFKSVRNFVSETVSHENVNILINNAGAVNLPDQITEDGLLNTMQVNYFGAFLLTYLLLPLMRKTSYGRIINVSAGTMYLGGIDFDHWNDIGRWSPISQLSNSKLAVSLFTVELASKIENTGVTANSFDPFLASETGILSNLPNYLQFAASGFVQIIGRSKSDVADELAYIATDEVLWKNNGKHYKFCGEWFNTWLANDLSLRRKLWDASKTLVGIKPDEEWDLES